MEEYCSEMQSSQTIINKNSIFLSKQLDDESSLDCLDMARLISILEKIY